MNRTWRLLMVAAVVAMGLFGIAGTVSAMASTTAVVQPCGSTPLSGNQTVQFDRCTSSSPSGKWNGLDCIENVNVNASGGSPFNVYSAYNNCPFRVWLHQYTNWMNNGWSYCISPDSVVYGIAAPYRNPLNIYLSANASAC